MKIIQYIMNIAESSRNEDKFRYGLSTRGLIALKKASQAWAFINGRSYVIPEDVKAIFLPVAYHRLNPPGEFKRQKRQDYLADFLEKVPVLL